VLHILYGHDVIIYNWYSKLERQKILEKIMKCFQFMSDEEFNWFDTFIHDIQPGISDFKTDQIKINVVCESIWFRVQHLKRLKAQN